MQLSSAQKGFLWIWDPTDFGDFGCGDAWGLLLPYITSVTVIIIITTTIIIIIWNIAASCLSDWKQTANESALYFRCCDNAHMT